MAKKKEEASHDYLATRTETFGIGDKDYHLVAGIVYPGADLPESLIESLTGDYGGLTLVEPGTLEVQNEDGEWVVAEEEGDA